MNGLAGFLSDGLTPRDFARLADFIQQTTGIKMPPSKQSLLEGRLRRRLRALGMCGFKEDCDFLFVEGGLDQEAIQLINAVTTNKTDFFREPDHFNYLAATALPQLARRGIGRDRPLTAWSAAASIGAEAYSMAMVMAEFGRTMPAFRFSVLATDICTEVLEAAHRAIYPEEMIRPVPEAFRQRYLLRSRDPGRALVRIAPGLRSRVRFARLNLIEAPYDLDIAVDLLFVRNILIYFEKSVQQEVLGELCRHLSPGGYLFIGHSESVIDFDLPVCGVATSIFRRE